MKIKLLFLFFLFFSCALFAADPNRTYQIKYILDSDGYAIPSESTVTVTPTKIYVIRNGETKYWDCEYKGVKIDKPDSNHEVKFHIYYLTNKKVYIIISDYKLVKHNGVFYYRFVIDGQVQLAL